MALKQLWFWFIGMLILTLPWHHVGLLGQPRRTAWIPYDSDIAAAWQPYQIIMAVGGLLLTVSALMFVYNLLMTHLNKHAETNTEVQYAEPIRPVLSLPKSMNGFALWNWILVFYMTASFGYPIAQFFFMDSHNVMAWGW